MANNNNQNKDGKVTAGELFDKLRSKNGDTAGGFAADELFAEETAEEKSSGNGFSIDVSAEDDSDSELDINDLLRKYMPEYGDDGLVEKKSNQSSVLSKLKQSAEDYSDLPYGVDDGYEADDDDSLISALDSAFGPEGDAENFSFADGDAMDEQYDGAVFADEEAFEEEERRVTRRERKKKEKKPFFLFGFGGFRGKKKDDFEKDSDIAEETVSVFEESMAESVEESFVEDRFDEVSSKRVSIDEISIGENEDLGFDVQAEAEQLEEFERSMENVSFRTTDIRLGDIADLENALNDPELGNRSTPETRKAGQPVEGLLDKLAEFEEEAAAAEPSVVADDAFDDGSSFARQDASAGGELPAEIASEDEIYEDFGAEDSPEAWEETRGEEIDPTDLNLRVAFGLDEEEQHDSPIGAKQFGDRLEEKQYRREKRAKLDRQEFVDKTQIPKIRKEYKDRLISLRIKLLCSVVLTAVLLWFENIPFLTELFTGKAQQFAGVFDPAIYPVVYIMASLQLMLLVCLCAYQQIFNGFKCLVRGIPKAESLLSLLFVTGVIYSAVLARLVETPVEPVMLNSVTALAAVLTLIYDLYNTKREKMNFDIVSSKKTKHIVRRLPDEESMSQARAFMEQTDACDVMKVEKTDFVDGFFGRMYQPDQTVTVFMTCMMSLAAAFAVLVGFFVNLRGGSSIEVLQAGYLALLAAAPVSVLVSFSYPFYRGTLAANEYDSAIIGESSLAEYSDASIISFDDKNVFPSYGVKIQNIKIFNNARVDRVLYYAASVFAHAGGPLQDVFEVATLEMGHSDDVQIFDTESGFLASQVNGVNIIFGSCGKLREKGFVIPDEYASDDVDFSEELSIMYMFREDKLVAKIYVKYVMDGDIDLILKQFQGTGLYVCVRTFDPNIDERMIAKKLNMRRIPLKVVRYASTEEVTMYEEKVDSGLVTNASPKSLLQVISYCDKILHTRRVDIAFSILALMIGVAGVLLLSGSLGAINSLIVAMYHLLWIVPTVISAKMFIR